MGFYSGSRLYQESYSSVPQITLEDVMRDDSIQPTEQEDLIEASLNIIENIQENQNRFFQHIGVAELDHFEQHGEELVYTESVLGDIVDTIKKFLMKIWERIKALFKRFIMIIDSYSKNDKDFAKKYQKDIFSKSGDTSDFTFKGYKWNIDTGKVNSLIQSCDDKATEMIKWAQTSDKPTGYMGSSTADTQKRLENISDEIEDLRGQCLKPLGINTGRMTEEEFRKELHEYFRGGETEKEELDSKDLDVHDMYNHLIQSQQDKKDVDQVFKQNKKSIEQTEKELLRLQNEYAKEAHEKYNDNENKTEDDPGNPTKKTITNLNEIDKDAVVNDYKKRYKTNTIQDSSGNHINIDKNDPNHIHIMVQSMGKSEYDYLTTSTSTITTSGKTTKRDKGNRYSKALNIAMRIVSASKSCVLTIDSEFLNAMKERSRQYKACLIAYVHYRPSSESAMEEQVYNEAAYTRFSSPLKGINLF